MRWLATVASPAEAADRADIVVFSDASSSEQSVGAYAPGVGYLTWSWPSGRDGKPDPTINELELVGLLLGAVVVALYASPRVGPRSPASGIHVHVWSDSSSALSWAYRRRAKNPVTHVLIMTLTLLQVARKIYFTFGHVPGEKNPVADALSRRFRVAPRQAEAVSAQLQDLPCLHPPECLLSAMQNALDSSSFAAYDAVLSALTVLDSVTGCRS